MILLSFLRRYWLALAVPACFLMILFAGLFTFRYARIQSTDRLHVGFQRRGLRMNGETLSLYPKEDADKIMKQETGYPEDFIEKLQKNQPDFTLYSLSVAEFSEGNDMYSVFSYYAVGNKFLLINPGLDGEFEDHPSEWFTATTTMESPEIVSRSYKAATLFSPSYGDVFAIGEFK